MEAGSQGESGVSHPNGHGNPIDRLPPRLTFRGMTRDTDPAKLIVAELTVEPAIGTAFDVRVAVDLASQTAHVRDCPEGGRSLMRMWAISIAREIIRVYEEMRTLGPSAWKDRAPE
jgi:hypothetical protein